MVSKSRQHTTRRVTIKDVARAAGVSVTTVSNVLNDRTGAMTEETLRRIQETIRTLEYRPSRIARSLVTSRTATIGVIVANIETSFFLQAIKIIEATARRADHNILLCTAHTLDDERRAVNLFLEKEVDGIIFLSTSMYLDSEDHLTWLLPSAASVVLVNRSTPHDRFDQINFDNVNGVITVIDHLVQLGHQHIAHLYGPATRSSSDERLLGYQLGLERHQLTYREDYVRSGDFEGSQEVWEQSTLELLALLPRPTAIIAADDIVAATAMRTVQRAGYHVPRDLSVVGIDDQPFCIYLNPILTTLRLPVIEAGKRAIEMLLQRIGRQRSIAEQVMLPCPLIIRESSGVAAVPDSS